MPNRKTGLDFSAFTIGGTAYIGDIENCEVQVQNKTAEGKGVAEIDDWPVLVGRKSSFTGVLEIPATGTAAFAAFATSLTPAGTVLITTGAGGGFSGTAVITDLKWRAQRDDVQRVDVTFETRGAFPFA